MKNMIVFLAALGLGALTVIGQDDDDPNRALKAELDRLTKMIEARTAQRQPPAEQRLVLRSYDVTDLCSPVRDEWLDPHNLRPSDYTAPEGAESEPVQPYAVDQIIELIRMTVAPDSWDVVEGADIMPKNGRVFVNTIPAVHALIPPLLKQLRALIDVQVAVEVVAVRVTSEAAAILAERPRELTASDVATLREQPVLGSARVVCFDGQQVVQRNGKRRGYVADYDVKVAEGAAMGQPIRAELFTGCAVQLRGALDRTGRGVVLHCHLERTAAGDVRPRNTAFGPLDLPQVNLTRVMTSFWAPLDKTVVAGVGSTGGDSCAFLVTARRVGSG